MLDRRETNVSRLSLFARLSMRLVAVVLAWSFLLPVVAQAAGEAPDDGVKTILEFLADKDKDIRAAALEKIRTEVKGPEATKRFADELPKLSPEAQVGLLAALADRGDTTARPAVLALLAAKPADPVRVAALTALGPLGEPADMPLLLKSLSEGPEAEQNAAKASLGRLKGDKLNAEIAAQLKDASPALRSALSDILGTRRAYDIVPALLPGAVDADQAVRMASMAALERLAGLEQIPDLLAGVLRAEAGPERDAAEKTVVAVCGRLDDKNERAAPVLAAFAKRSADEQLVLLSVLARLGTPEVMPTFDDALEGGNAERRQAALEALGLWPNGSIAAKLFTLTKNAADGDEHAVAFRSLVRVSSIRDERSDEDRLAQLKKDMTLAQIKEEKAFVINRCRTAYTVDALRYVLPYVDDPEFSAVACETVVELAHHRELREPSKPEFDAALDKVVSVTNDDVLKERSRRYKANQTWERPKTKPASPKAAKAGDEDDEAAAPAQLSPGLIAAIAGGIALVLLAVLLLRRKSPRT